VRFDLYGWVEVHFVCVWILFVVGVGVVFSVAFLARAFLGGGRADYAAGGSGRGDSGTAGWVL
jgi:hypothetical protein